MRANNPEVRSSLILQSSHQNSYNSEFANENDYKNGIDVQNVSSSQSGDESPHKTLMTRKSNSGTGTSSKTGGTTGNTSFTVMASQGGSFRREQTMKAFTHSLHVVEEEKEKNSTASDLSLKSNQSQDESS